jgi:RNA polymerase sigma factor (sigma-70 family)
MTMNDKDIMGMCKKLAYRYNSEAHREDMMQEGILVCYEVLAEEPDAHPAKLYRAAKSRMHDYLNIDTLPVTMPKSDTIRSLTHTGEAGSSSEYSTDTVQWIKNVLSSDKTPYDDDFAVSDLDQAQEYEDREYNEYVRALALCNLTRQEWHVIKLRYYEGYSQEDVALGLRITQQAVSLSESKALSKLRDKIL